ncbi:MAG: hypothetical protein JZD41_00970 [Thermoproteus sp.]|nr:hypothetical protein [Thermoproteus sp.]
MRPALALALLSAAVALAAQLNNYSLFAQTNFNQTVQNVKNYSLWIGPNSTVRVIVAPNYVEANGTRINVSTIDMMWVFYPPSQPYRVIVGAIYPFSSSSCSLQQGPSSFSISCSENEPMTLIYVTSPGYGVYCDQQPAVSSSQGLITVNRYNALRLNCRLGAGASASATSGLSGALFLALASATVFLAIAVSLSIFIIVRRIGAEGSSR